MGRAWVIVAGVVIGSIAALLARQAQAKNEGQGVEVASWKQEALYDAASVVYDVTGLDMRNWQLVASRPENAVYVQLLRSAEVRSGIPHGMLVRLAYQESRFRQDIITGKTVSSAGAVGIMQIVPRWHPTVNPLDPAAAIAYAGNYLASLYRQFGTWEMALQAYNWGPGNLKKYLQQGGALPLETANYSGQILADLNSIGVYAA